MKTFITIVILALIVYGGYRLYQRFVEPVGVIIDQAKFSPSADLTGTYVSKNATIEVSQVNGIRLEVVMTSRGWSQNATDTEWISGSAGLRKNVATFSKDGCKVVMTFYEDTMTAEDNGSCGGFYASYTGEYVRQ